MFGVCCRGIEYGVNDACVGPRRQMNDNVLHTFGPSKATGLTNIPEAYLDADRILMRVVYLYDMMYKRTCT